MNSQVVFITSLTGSHSVSHVLDFITPQGKISTWSHLQFCQSDGPCAIKMLSINEKSYVIKFLVGNYIYLPMRSSWDFRKKSHAHRRADGETEVL